jgi:hypothetical protein
MQRTRQAHDEALRDALDAPTGRAWSHVLALRRKRDDARLKWARAYGLHKQALALGIREMERTGA